MKKTFCLILAALSVSSCGASVRHYYPASIENMSRSELVELNSPVYPFIEGIDGQYISYYRRPLYILPGKHAITLRPRAGYEADPAAVLLDAKAGDIYSLSYEADWSGDEGRSGTWAAKAERTGRSEPPPHHLLMRYNGLVYIYRPDKLFGPGSEVAFPFFLDGEPLQYLYPGSLCPVMIRPGPASFSVEGAPPVRMDIVAGEVYYLKGGVSMGFSGGLVLSLVPPGEGEKEIRDTWMNALCHEVPRGYYPLVIEAR